MSLLPFSARLLFIALVLTVPAFANPGLGAAVMPPPTGGAGASLDNHNQLEHDTFSLINQYRKANNLPSFQWTPVITEVARKHSKDMATGDSDFGHDGFNRRVDQLKGVMVGLKGAGENVLRTDDPDQVAQRAVEVWLKSPHHLANIRGDFNYSGLGIWEDDKGMIYFTQIFVKIVPPAQTAQAVPSPPPQVTTPFGFLAAPNTR